MLSSLIKKTVLQSRNYLFPVSTLTIISAPAPAPAIAIYWHLKLFLNTSTGTIGTNIGRNSFSLSSHPQN